MKIKAIQDKIFDENPNLMKSLYNTLGLTFYENSGRTFFNEYDGQSYIDAPRISYNRAIQNRIKKIVPNVPKGYKRFYRGARIGESGSNPVFTDALLGIAISFMGHYNGVMSYVDVPKEDLDKIEISNAGPSEYDFPKELLSNVHVLPKDSFRDIEKRFPGRMYGEHSQGDNNIRQAYLDYRKNVSSAIGSKEDLEGFRIFMGRLDKKNSLENKLITALSSGLIIVGLISILPVITGNVVGFSKTLRLYGIASFFIGILGFIFLLYKNKFQNFIRKFPIPFCGRA